MGMQIHFHFGCGCRANLYRREIYYVFIVWNLIGDRIFLQSERGSGYDTRRQPG